ncbi:MAG: DUF2183 domain-containing protein [Actinomycetaceae bacterium]|nr:DUF2183 domain-containing protein [Actinomycetaceae bacterium]
MILTAVTKFGDIFNGTVARLLADLGWRPEMIGYGGIGSLERVRVIGRALMSPTPFEEKFEAWAKNTGVPTLRDLTTAAERVGTPGVDVLKEAIGEDDAEPDAPTSTTTRGERGWRQFIDAQIPFQPVLVRVGGRRKLVYADRGGYVDIVIHRHGLSPGWHIATLQALDSRALARGERRVRASRPVSVPVRIIAEAETHGVVSDVDDTVMISWLPRPVVAAKNAFFTYVSSRQAVPGMARFLNRLSVDYGIRAARGASTEHPRTATVYLSTGAWNVAPGLRRFLARGEFPTGTPLFTDWGPSQTGWFRSGPEHKRSQLRRLARELPWVEWFLVGDDGQNDPELYSEFAAEYPENVAAICIRTLTPAEQVLSHGLDITEALEQRMAAVPDSIPIIVGEDGHALTREARRAGLL